MTRNRVTAGSRAALLDSDRALNTGVVNPGGSGGLAAGATLATSTAGMSVDFLTPVVNGPGEDVLLIEFAATTAQAFDAVTFSGLTGGPGFGTPRTSTGSSQVTAKELTGTSLTNDAFTEPNPVASLADLESKTTTMTTHFATPAYHALAIDLTGLGVPEGAVVTGLHI